MNPFSSIDPPAPAPMPPMRADQALHNLHMHKRSMFGIGGLPGRQGQPPPIEGVHRKILRNAKAIKRGRGLNAAEKAKDRRDYARRRRNGDS